MSENRDPAIKLFGKTILLPANGGEEERVEDVDVDVEVYDEEMKEVRDGEEDGDGKELVKEPMNEKNDEEDDKNEQLAATEEQLTNSGPANSESENPKTPSLDKETPLAKSVKPEEEQSEANNSKEKPALKKPDKILPCPRCNSLDTKFCYYNNYNVNQPRHFCKNCQRYWTAGGTMRNVPVGAGRRKNKNSANHYRHITVSEAIQTVRSDHSEVVPHRIPLKPNGTVLSFSADAPLCESMSSALSLGEKSMKNCYRNGFHVPEEQTIPVSNGVEIGDEQSTGPSVTASTISTEDGGNRMNIPEPAAAGSYPGFTQIPCFPPAPWPYPWNAPQWRTPIPPQSAPPPPPYCNSSFPVSFFPATAYWGCTMPGPWSIPWISPPSPSAASCRSELNSPTLGKHSREENSLKQSDIDKEDPAEKNNSERCLWIPKTLRIDDPGEAAKSSIWTTLGLKNDKAEGISGGGLFKAFHSKSEERSRTLGASQVLHANPAALSRSISFRAIS